MTITRVTQSMLSQRSLEGLQLSLGRLARTQEQISTGRVLNRPSDSPTDTTAAMRLRSSLADSRQYARTAQDGLGWLGQIDATLQSMVNETRRVRDLTLQGASSGSMSATSREALAIEVEQLQQSLISQANTKYLERPVFGGVTAGSIAFDPSGAYVGTTAGEVTRTIAEGVTVRVDMDATDAFGPNGELFAVVGEAANALRSGNQADIDASLDKLALGLERLVGSLSEVGGRTNRLEAAVQRAKDSDLSITASLTEIENVDLPRAMVDLQLQEVAYQAALAATARVMQPSLLDFLR